MNSLRSPFAVLLLAVAGLAAAAPGRADWLVTKDGARIETRGTWKVEGRQVIFTLPNGTLSALRTEEIDLDRSAVVTAHEAEAVQKAAEPAPAPRKAPVMTLTEKDIPPALDPALPVEELDPDKADEGEEESEGAAEEPKADEPASDLQVISWDKVPNATGDGLEIAGTMKNSGTNNVTSPSVVATVYDQDGRLLATAEGSINAGIILAGRTANFRISLPGVTDFVGIKFDAQGRGFKTGGNAEEGSEAAGSEAPAEDEGTTQR